MKNIVLLFVLSFVFSLNIDAQKTVFISDSHVDWLDREVKNLESLYKQAVQVYEKNNLENATSIRSNLRKSVIRMASNTAIINSRIEYELSPQSQRPGMDMLPDAKFERKRKTGKLDEFLLTEAQYEQLVRNSEKMDEIRDSLKQNSFNISAESTNAQYNLEQLESMIKFAKDSNSIIQSNKVDL